MRQVIFRYAFVLGLLCALVLTAGCSEPEPPLRFTVILADSGGLQSGQPVVIDEETIGQVTSVTSESRGSRVEVEIAPEHRLRVLKEFQFEVESSAAGSTLNIADTGGGSTPVAEGEVLDFRGNWLDQFASGLQQMSDAAREALKNLGPDLDKALAALRDSEEAQALKESLTEFSQDLSTVARSRYKNFVEKEIPELETKAQAYKDKLISEGRGEEAEVFWKWFSRLSDSVKNALPEARAEEPEKKPQP